MEELEPNIITISWVGDKVPEDTIQKAVDELVEHYADEVWMVRPTKAFSGMKNTVVITNKYMTQEQATSHVWNLIGFERTVV